MNKAIQRECKMDFAAHTVFIINNSTSVIVLFEHQFKMLEQGRNMLDIFATIKIKIKKAAPKSVT